MHARKTVAVLSCTLIVGCKRNREPLIGSGYVKSCACLLHFFHCVAKYVFFRSCRASNESPSGSVYHQNVILPGQEQSSSLCLLFERSQALPALSNMSCQYVFQRFFLSQRQVAHFIGPHLPLYASLLTTALIIHHIHQWIQRPI